MKWSAKCCVLIVAATIAGAAVRLPSLSGRPMHTDEAVQAVKFGELLEGGRYYYNPREYHGPAMNYFTLIAAWLSGVRDLAQTTEVTLRIVPVFFGVLLVLLVWLIKDGLGPAAACCAAVLTAISPAMVFYSRYYIHEMLLVYFSFAVIVAGYRYGRSEKRKWLWSLMGGISAGLMHATKETCIIAAGAMLLALLIVRLKTPTAGPAAVFGRSKRAALGHLLIAAAAAIVVSGLFYSSFFKNPQGIADSFKTYAGYFAKAGQNDLHIHPWYFYLKLLSWHHYEPAPVWTELFIIILAAAGLVCVLAGKFPAWADAQLLRFIAFYTVIMTAAYAVIPYKTPWCLLGFLHGMILLAGVGMAALVRGLSSFIARAAVILIFTAGGAHIAWQAYMASYKFYADPRNPYVYAQTSEDIFKITERVKDIAAVHPDKLDMEIQVICPGNDYWPLPWYLRQFHRVGYRDYVDEAVPAAPVIIALPSVEAALMKKLYESPPPGQRNLYVPLFDSYTQLRPQVEIRGYVTGQLWDIYQQHRGANGR